jgi:hypothetical protein
MAGGGVNSPWTWSSLRSWDGVGKLNDNELARQHRYLHGRLTLEDDVPTPNARVVQEFVQIWREVHRRG